MEKTPEGRDLDLFIYNEHPEASPARCEPPSGATSADAAVTTPVELLASPILLKIAPSSNSKFYLVFSNPELKELTIYLTTDIIRHRCLLICSIYASANSISFTS